MLLEREKIIKVPSMNELISSRDTMAYIEKRIQADLKKELEEELGRASETDLKKELKQSLLEETRRTVVKDMELFSRVRSIVEEKAKPSVESEPESEPVISLTDPSADPEPMAELTVTDPAESVESPESPESIAKSFLERPTTIAPGAGCGLFPEDIVTSIGIKTTSEEHNLVVKIGGKPQVHLRVGENNDIARETDKRKSVESAGRFLMMKFFDNLTRAADKTQGVRGLCVQRVKAIILKGCLQLHKTPECVKAFLEAAYKVAEAEKIRREMEKNPGPDVIKKEEEEIKELSFSKLLDTVMLSVQEIGGVDSKEEEISHTADEAEAEVDEAKAEEIKKRAEAFRERTTKLIETQKLLKEIMEEREEAEIGGSALDDSLGDTGDTSRDEGSNSPKRKNDSSATLDNIKKAIDGVKKIEQETRSCVNGI
jgi:hypothetical protein